MKGHGKNAFPTTIPSRETADHSRLKPRPGPWTSDRWAIIEGAGSPGRANSPCAAPECDETAQYRVHTSPHALCYPHWFQWYRAGKPTDVDAWLPHARPPQRRVRTNAVSTRVIDFTSLPPLIAAEIRYVAGEKITSGDWTPSRSLLNFLTGLAAVGRQSDAASLLDRRVEDWSLLLRAVLSQSDATASRSYLKTFFATLYRALVADPWLEDKWLWKNGMDRLVTEGSRSQNGNNIDWQKIKQEWIREPVKAHAKTQLVTGKRAWGTVITWVQALGRLSEYLDLEGVDLPELLDRDLFLDYIAWSIENGASKHALSGINVAAAVLSAVQDEPRRRRAAGDMTAHPVFGSEVFLRFGENVVEKGRRPKPYPADVVERIDREILADPGLEPSARGMLQLTRWGGFRVSELVQTPIDCLLHNGKDGYWINYYMTKTKRRREFPIPNDLAEELLSQQQWVRDTYGENASYLFPSPSQSNPSAGVVKPWSTSGFRNHIAAAFRRNGLTQSSITGERITGGEIHRYRHTIGTALLNNGWTQREVKEFLGHDSETMTASYAAILDETLVRKINEFHEAQQANAPDPGQPIAHPGVERLRARFAYVLADGTCALPANQHCDIRDNPCADCAFYDPSGDDVRPVHENRRRRLKLHIENTVDPAEVALNERALRATEQALADEGGAA